MSSGPRISVVIPVYNLRTYVAEAIESVLAQTLAPADLEIVVVDDGSTDGSGNVAARYAPRVRVIRHENRGLSATRNVGIRATTAPFLTFLDADDRIHPEKLAAQLAVFDQHPDIGAVYTDTALMTADGTLLPQRSTVRWEGDILEQLAAANVGPVHAVLVRRGPVEQCGGFDESLTSVEDWDLWIRLTQAGVRWACVPRPLTEYRIRPSAMHTDPGRMLRNRERVLGRLFSEPTIPPALAARRDLAYQNAYLVAAGDAYQAGDASNGRRWFAAAVATRPALLTEPDTLALFCRWLLPMGYQTGTLMAAEWHRLLRTLRDASRATCTATSPPPEIARLRWPAEMAAWRAMLPFIRRRMRAGLPASGRRRRLVRQVGMLRAFEQSCRAAGGGTDVERAAG